MLKVGKSLAEIEAVVERSHHLAWWQYLVLFILVQVLVIVIFKQSSKMMQSDNNGRGSGKLRPTLSRLFSIPSMSYAQFANSRNNSPQNNFLQRTWSISPKRYD